MQFLQVNSELYFYHLQAGTDPIAFEADRMGRLKWLGTPGQWSDWETWGQDNEVAWQYHSENGTSYTVSYSGSVLREKADIKGTVNLYFNSSEDGVNWAPVDPEIQAGPLFHELWLSIAFFKFPPYNVRECQGDLHWRYK